MPVIAAIVVVALISLVNAAQDSGRAAGLVLVYDVQGPDMTLEMLLDKTVNNGIA